MTEELELTNKVQETRNVRVLMVVTVLVIFLALVGIIGYGASQATTSATPPALPAQAGGSGVKLYSPDSFGLNAALGYTGPTVLGVCSTLLDKTMSSPVVTTVILVDAPCTGVFVKFSKPLALAKGGQIWDIKTVRPLSESRSFLSGRRGQTVIQDTSPYTLFSLEKGYE